MLLSALPAAGWLYQQADSLAPEEITFTPVSEVQPTEQQLADLKFAWRCVKHVKSNAITVAKEGRLLGMGSGQPNRVKSVQIALEKADAHVQVRARALACRACQFSASTFPLAPALLAAAAVQDPGTCCLIVTGSWLQGLLPVIRCCLQGSVLASDAFFPFSWNDSVEMACKAGVKAIVHPGGSMRDQDAVDCCNKYGVALLTTSVRHFR